MIVKCENCLPKEGIEISDFTISEKRKLTELTIQSSLHSTKYIIDNLKLSHREAKYIVTHINIIYGQCKCCKFDKLDKEYMNCPKCGALNFNWKIDNEQKFKLWLEFEEVDPNNWDIENEFCNIHVDLEDGRYYGINVWTYKYLETTINEDRKTGQNLSGLYQKPPDLFVKELTRECIQQTIEDLLKIDDLEKVLNPSIYDKRN
jgi:hypothetical protein